MEGMVNLIDSESMLKKVMVDVKRKRKEREKKLKVLIAKYGEDIGEKEMQKARDNELLNAGLGPNDFLSDFPQESLSKTDFKKIKCDQTFGNNKILTNKGFRPSFAIAEGRVIKIVKIPLKKIQDVIVQISNSGENKVKSEFFKQLSWFEAFGQSYKTKFNNATSLKIFYPR